MFKTKATPKTLPQKLRLEKLRLENSTCEVCGKEGYLVHHKNRIRKDNTPNNLKCVCYSCHWEIHRTPPKYSSLTVREILKLAGCSHTTALKHLSGKKKSIGFGALIDKIISNNPKIINSKPRLVGLSVSLINRPN